MNDNQLLNLIEIMKILNKKNTKELNYFIDRLTHQDAVVIPLNLVNKILNIIYDDKNTFSNIDSYIAQGKLQNINSNLIGNICSEIYGEAFELDIDIEYQDDENGELNEIQMFEGLSNLLFDLLDSNNSNYIKLYLLSQKITKEQIIDDFDVYEFTSNYIENAERADYDYEIERDNRIDNRLEQERIDDLFHRS